MLLTNGCSFVWGDELEGCYEDPPNHRVHTFTDKLAGKLNMPYINLASCGGGNDKIFRDTILHLSDPDQAKPTHMVILWSGWGRAEFVESRPEIDGMGNPLKIQRYDDITQISPERVANLLPDKWGAMYKYYDGCYNSRTPVIQHLSKMVAMQTLCDSMNIKLIQGAFHVQMRDGLRFIMQENHTEGNHKAWTRRVEYMLGLLRKESKVGLTAWKDMYSLAKEKYTVKRHGHPDEDAHTEYADLLYHIFNRMQ